MLLKLTSAFFGNTFTAFIAQELPHVDALHTLLTSHGTQSWLAPQQAQWPPGHQRCVYAHSPSAAPQSSPPQRSDCPAQSEGHTAGSLLSSRKGRFPRRLMLPQMFYCNETAPLTGPTNPRSPDRTNGISPMGTPLALTGITWTQWQKDRKRNELTLLMCEIVSAQVGYGFNSTFIPQRCFWWVQADRSTCCLQHGSWLLSLLSHLFCTTEEARLV